MVAAPLSCSLVTADGHTPRGWVLFLHGFLGRGANWRTVARRWVALEPTYGAVLVDLRMHGGSQAMPPPHTVAQAARDVSDLEPHVPGPVVGVLGHSFGGKVALAYVAVRQGDINDAWIIDAPPGPLDAAHATDEAPAQRFAAARVLAALDALGTRFDTREQFVVRLRERGFDQGLTDWLAMNLVRDSDGVRLALDRSALHALLEDFWTTDLWSLVEHPPGHVRLHWVVGVHSEALAPSARQRLQARAAAPDRRVSWHWLPTGHWVHVDDPMGLVDVMRQTRSP